MTKTEEVIFAAEMYLERAGSSAPDKITRDSKADIINNLEMYFKRAYAEDFRDHPEMRGVAEIYFLYSKWMMDKTVYQFHENFFGKPAVKAAKSIVMYQEPLRNLPCQCFYMPIVGQPGIIGMFVYVELNGDNEMTFRIQDICGVYGKVIDAGSATIRLKDGDEVGERIENWLSTIDKRKDREKHFKFVADLLSIAIQSAYYLVSENATIEQVKVPKAKRLKTNKGKIININYFNVT